MSLLDTDGSIDFKSSMESLVSGLIHKTNEEKRDPELDYLQVTAPNIIEFSSSPQYLNIPSIFHHVRQYQILRDFFQYRCPICNSQKPEAIDCWDKGREYLESEALLVWTPKYDDDMCPKCNTTRTEFEEDDLLYRYNQLHGIVGMRSLVLEWGMIYTNKGLLTAEEIINNIKSQRKDGHNICYELDFDVYGENGIEPASHVIFEGKKPSKILNTQLGMKMEVSPIHPMRVLTPNFTREWIESKDLEEGNYLCVKVGANLWGNNKLNSDIARILGYLIADGSINSSSLNFTTGKEEIIKECVKSAKILNINVSYRKCSDMDAYEWSTKNKSAEAKLRELGVGEWKSRTKEVPISVRQSDKDTVCEFLKAYMSCDGWCAILSSGSGHKKAQVGFDTVSEKLALHIRLLLLNMGIVTSMSETKSRKFKTNEKLDHTVYMVRINSEYLELFEKEIGFIDHEKQSMLRSCIDLVKSSRRRSNINNIPETGLFIREYLKKIDVNEGCKLDSKGNVYKGSITTKLFGKDYETVRACWKSKNKTASRELVQLVIDRTKEYGKKHCPEWLQRLENFCDESWIYLPIVSIEDGETEMADLHVPKSHSFIANGFLNHNSGKTATAAMIGCWVEHILVNIALKQPDFKLANYFGLLPKQPFEVTYIASTEVQSTDTIWAYYRSMRVDSPWFKRYVSWVKQKEKEQLTPVGMEKWEYKETTRQINNEHMGVKFNSKNSNSSGLAGRTRIASMVDELSRFKQTESSMGADEAYRVMEASLRTVRSSVENRGLIRWLGLMASISSPISVDDKGMELLYQSTNIKKMYSFHYATWEFNPDEKREYYDESFEKDPVGTERDFGAKPPLAANPLIVDIEKFESRAVDPDLKPTAAIEIIPFIDKTGQRYHKAYMSECRLLRDAARYVVFDAGRTFDSFAGACGHLEMKQLDDGNLEFVTVVDWVLRILPSNDIEVWFDSAVDIVKTQLNSQKIAQVEFDRWNSVTLIQQIRNLGVRAEQKSIKAEDYIKFVSDCHMGRVKLLPKEAEDDALDPPFKSAQAVGLYEIERLERSIDDRKILNPQKGKRRGYNSDDVAVCLVHLHKMCQDSQIMPTGAKLRSREARLKREEVGSQQYQMGSGGTVFNPSRLGGIHGNSRRRW